MEGEGLPGRELLTHLGEQIETCPGREEEGEGHEPPWPCSDDPLRDPEDPREGPSVPTVRYP